LFFSSLCLFGICCTLSIILNGRIAFCSVALLLSPGSLEDKLRYTCHFCTVYSHNTTQAVNKKEANTLTNETNKINETKKQNKEKNKKQTVKHAMLTTKVYLGIRQNKQHIVQHNTSQKTQHMTAQSTPHITIQHSTRQQSTEQQKEEQYNTAAKYNTT
jgi:hypothetical protein